MEAYAGSGCWYGLAEGRIVWVGGAPDWDRTPIRNRAEEITHLKEVMARALCDVDQWMERQDSLGGRIVLQGFREALQDPSFIQRATMLIDQHGLPAPAAIEEAAALVSGVMARSEELAEKAGTLPVAARWLARRLVPVTYPENAVLAADQLSPLELLDRTHPAVIASGDPGIAGEVTLVWGVSQLRPDWDGYHARIAGDTVYVAPREVDKAMQYEAAREAVLETARSLKREGLVRLTSGNVSCRIPGTNLFAVTPSGMDYDTLQPADICILDLEGRMVDGRRRPSTEAPLHRLTYESRPDIHGVVHTHSLYASAFACTGQDLPVISTELAGLVGGTVRCAPYARSGTEEFGMTALNTLGHDLAVLLQNHGAVAVGQSLAEAYKIAVGLEEAATIYYLARQMGEPIVLPEAERSRIFKVMHSRYGQEPAPHSDLGQEA